ncbi:MAG: hypothetical protein IH969_07675 [Candidatus Krumholzibacteriota bacterium]|nr:hypothetical protein [Candidatus Krumholzibacteriota bacterium]
MKILGIILIVIGIAAAAPVALIGKKHIDRVAVHEAVIDSLEQERKETIEERQRVHLARRATMESIQVNPDSVRMEQSGRISKRLKDLSQESRMLTGRETEFRRLQRRENRHRKEEALEAKQRAMPFAIAAAVSILAGMILSIVGRRQHA